MAVNIPIGYALTTLSFSNGALAGEAVITFGVDLRTVTDPFQDVCDGIGSAFVDTINTRMSTSFFLEKCTLRMPTETGDVTLETVLHAQGLVGGAQAPPNAAYLVQKRTGFAGKRNRGRFFLPGVQMDTLTNNRSDLVASGSLALLFNQCALFLEALGDMSVFMVILHDEAFSDPPRLVTSLVPMEKIATQRGRLRD
jgi:hypothetical protein